MKSYPVYKSVTFTFTLRHDKIVLQKDNCYLNRCIRNDSLYDVIGFNSMHGIIVFIFGFKSEWVSIEYGVDSCLVESTLHASSFVPIINPSSPIKSALLPSFLSEDHVAQTLFYQWCMSSSVQVGIFWNSIAWQSFFDIYFSPCPLHLNVCVSMPRTGALRHAGVNQLAYPGALK